MSDLIGLLKDCKARDARQRHARPVHYLLTRTIPRWWGRACQRASDAVWRIRHRWQPRHRYNIVHTGLPVGYHDDDRRILWACFACLEAHVTRGMASMGNARQRPDGTWEIRPMSADDLSGWPSEEAKAEAAYWDEAHREPVDLYNWWMARKTREAAGEEIPDEEDAAALHKLVDMRTTLWT